MNCLSVTGRDEVSIIGAERQAVDVDEPATGGRIPHLKLCHTGACVRPLYTSSPLHSSPKLDQFLTLRNTEHTDYRAL